MRLYSHGRADEANDGQADTAIQQIFGVTGHPYLIANRCARASAAGARTTPRQRLFEEIASEPDFEYLLDDRTIVRPPQHSGGSQKSLWGRYSGLKPTQWIGGKVGGAPKSTSPPTALANPVHFILTGGQRNDMTQIEPLPYRLKAVCILAAKGYD